MQRGHSYPPDLARYVQERWPEAHTLPLPEKLFAEALATAYQASMTSEEGRPTRFRLLLTPFQALPAGGVPNEGVLRLRFDPSRPLHEDELRRLSPATPFETALIGAHVEVEGRGSSAHERNEEERLRIWGIAHSGPAWLAPTWGGRSTVPNWSYDPIVHVTGPGRLAVRCAGKLIGGLERGLIVDAVLDVFDSEWLPGLFAEQREATRAEHAQLQSQFPSPTLVDNSLIGRISQHMLRRVIQLVRGARHGGMICIVDDSCELHGLRLKYRFNDDEPARRYHTLLMQILQAVADASEKESVGWSDFALDDNAHFEQLEQAVFELSRLLANLSCIDGAVVVDKRLRLLGFGAEVSAELPTPQRVWRALDTEGSQRELDDFENVGTRHRASYRFVNDHPRGLAIVISHDGGVSFVANREGEIVFWEQSVSP